MFWLQKGNRIFSVNCCGAMLVFFLILLMFKCCIYFESNFVHFYQSREINVECLVKTYICLMPRIEVLKLHFIKTSLHLPPNSKPEGISLNKLE